MRQIAEFVSVLACALFTGAAIYITFIEHPARMHCGVEVAATEFAPSYRRATVMQATCAAVGLASSIAAWIAGASFWWLVAGVLLGSVIPFTLIVILPCSRILCRATRTYAGSAQDDAKRKQPYCDFELILFRVGLAGKIFPSPDTFNLALFSCFSLWARPLRLLRHNHTRHYLRED